MKMHPLGWVLLVGGMGLSFIVWRESHRISLLFLTGREVLNGLKLGGRERFFAMVFAVEPTAGYIAVLWSKIFARLSDVRNRHDGAAGLKNNPVACFERNHDRFYHRPVNCLSVRNP